MGNIDQDDFLHNTTIDNFMLDSSILDSNVDSIQPTVPRQIAYPSVPPWYSNIDNHCKMPTGDILYYVNNLWMSHSETLDKCGLSKLHKYTKDNDLNQVYGTAAQERNKKNINRMLEKQKKCKRSETRSFINRLAKTNTTRKKNQKPTRILLRKEI